MTVSGSAVLKDGPCASRESSARQRAMLRFDLGGYSRAVTTCSREAQRWFDIGLNWCFGFNHEEGVRCFETALTHDPDCVMAHWGIAYGLGPFYNFVWRDFGAQEASIATRRAHAHLAKARSLNDRASGVENSLVETLAARFQEPNPVAPDVYDRWDDDYAAAMRRLQQRFPDDRDVAALLVEALITRTPRRLWDLKTGQPAPGSDAADAGLPQHPAVVHLHIHILEMSSEPERAMQSADALATLCPDAGHMNHMPAHIYVLCGDYERAKQASDRAVAADDMYAAYDAPLSFYVTARCHDLHLLMFACMFLGQYGPALRAAEKMRGIISADIVRAHNRPKLATTAEGYYGTKMHVLVRFGRWHDILEEPVPGDPEVYLTSTAMHHYARGIARASLKDFAAADAERVLFQRSSARIPPGRRFLSNPVSAILGVAETMLDGEIAYHKGHHREAYDHLRESVRRDDSLGYTEPWAWMHPPRHALAALLLEQGHAAEAEQVYRDDLGLSGHVQRCTQHAENVWALHGLAECLARRGEQEEILAIRKKLAVALSKADVPITSSCLCRTQVVRSSSTWCV